MTMTVLIPLLVAIIGGLLYILTTNKVSEMGRLLFFAGALVSCLQAAGKTIHLP